MLSRLCEFCGAEFRYNLARSGTARFCSKTCWYCWHVVSTREAVERVCRRCARLLPVARFRNIRKTCRDCDNAKHREIRATGTGRDKRRVQLRRWKEANPDRVKLHDRNKTHKRRSIKAATGGVSIAEWNRVLALHHDTCVYCGATGIPLTQDHVLPLSRGGEHTINNLVPACAACNSNKHTSTLSEWFLRRLDIKQGILERGHIANA